MRSTMGDIHWDKIEDLERRVASGDYTPFFGFVNRLAERGIRLDDPVRRLMYWLNEEDERKAWILLHEYAEGKGAP